ncbi:MAG TPA: hypothetical protein VKS24_24765 [Bradyrhizobium sp.]|nr:hypothetical protein [Bradyrhizobium sp.]
MTKYLETPTLSLEKRRDALIAMLKTMSLNDPGRPKLAQLIVRIEDEIAAKEQVNG